MASVTALSRRTMLRGLGTWLALPWLEAMGQLHAWAEDAGPRRTAPNRLAFLYVPNGKDMAHWTPQGTGSAYDLPTILQPLAPHRADLNILTGFAADKARPHGDGGGDHARAMSAFLTGTHPRKTDGTDIRCGTSVDQLAAQRIGALTRFPSLEIGCEQGNLAGNCDSGYSCVYSNTMSWRSPTQPLPKEVNPRLVFERLFGGGDAKAREQRQTSRQSVLDFIREDSKHLQNQLGRADQQKLDEYFTSIREVEVRLARAASLPPLAAPTDFPRPAGIPDSYEEQLRLMADLMVLAFRTDATRVCTFVLANEGSNKAYPWLGVNEAHHELSHHGRDPAKLAKLRSINQFHVRQFAYVVEKLKAAREGDGTLLDHCMIAYGSGNSDGDAHNHDNLPILLAGRAGGSIRTGRHLRLGQETPLTNLWCSLLERIDIRTPVGDSNGVVRELTA